MERITAPTFKNIEQVNLLNPHEERLDNGIALFAFEACEQDLVRIEWVFNNISFDHLVNPVLNMGLAGMLLEGTKQHSSAEIAEKIDFYGAFLQPEYSFDHTALTLYVLHKHINHVLPLIKEILIDSIFPAHELDTYIRNNKQNLSVSLKKNDFIARRTFNQAIFGSGRYGFSPELNDYDTLCREDLQRLYTHQICPSQCTIYIAGKVTSETISSINRLFGQAWKDEPIVDVSTYAIPQVNTEDKVILIKKPDALQSAIRIGCASINRAHPDFSALQLVNTILGGYFGSRLMTNIREEKGYTYGIGSGIGALKHGAFFTIATEVGVSVTQETLTEIESEINRLRTSPIENEELDLVKNYIGGTFLGSLENVFSHVDKFKNVHTVGLDLTYYKNHLDVIKRSTADDILAIANKYLDYKKMVKVVVGRLEY
ncbi:pitrilysin family protein [Olivibacter ginsenosidimutans]|uniref:Pitrilysin family protein n=1 Tax=Olivibacter ginsenosidimutans TaxID=1176537 RepID=A0ABP9AYJ4_9SPHI